MSATDRPITGAAGATVVVLAGAISYPHLAELARPHREVGWRADALPVSVDGIEVVASLVLLAHRRAGWLPLAAVAAGMAANVAIGASDPIGRPAVQRWRCWWPSSCCPNCSMTHQGDAGTSGDRIAIADVSAPEDSAGPMLPSPVGPAWARMASIVYEDLGANLSYQAAFAVSA